MLSANKLTLYNFEWQVLRTNLIFSSEESTKDSIQKCKEYLNSEKDINKVWRVLNLINATKMGFSGSSKLVKSLEKKKDLEKRNQVVKAFGEHLSKIYNQLKDQDITYQTEKEQLDDLNHANTDDFGRVYESLIHRYENSNQSKSRQELKRYLDLMKKSLTDRKDKKQINQYVDRAARRLKQTFRDKALDWMVSEG